MCFAKNKKYLHEESSAIWFPLEAFTCPSVDHWDRWPRRLSSSPRRASLSNNDEMEGEEDSNDKQPKQLDVAKLVVVGRGIQFFFFKLVLSAWSDERMIIMTRVGDVLMLCYNFENWSDKRERPNLFGGVFREFFRCPSTLLKIRTKVWVYRRQSFSWITFSLFGSHYTPWN